MKLKKLKIEKPEVASDKVGNRIAKNLRERVEKNTLCKGCKK